MGGGAAGRPEDSRQKTEPMHPAPGPAWGPCARLVPPGTGQGEGRDLPWVLIWSPWRVTQDLGLTPDQPPGPSQGP